MKYNQKKFFLFFFILLLLAEVSAEADNLNIPASIAKWYNNLPAAISITYDHGNPASKTNRLINRFVLENGLTIDYEVVTFDYLRNSPLREFLLKKIVPAKLGYFGHGHQHINHDKLPYKKAYSSFKRCFDTLKSFGLHPVAYAYPCGAGLNPKTREALEKSGFLSGRLFFSKQMTQPLIIPGAEIEPGDWFALPTLVMQDYNFAHCSRCVNNNSQLNPYLDKTLLSHAWIILTYHAIGEENGYGFYKLEEFKKDILSIKERRFWNASMNSITLYVRERRHARATLTFIRHKKKVGEIKIILSDSLPNDIYNQPLTILFNIPDFWINKKLALVEKNKIVDTFVFNSANAMISIIPDETERKLVPMPIMPISMNNEIDLQIFSPLRKM